MSIRTTITLDEDVAERVKQASRARGIAFKEMLNDLLRLALSQLDTRPQPRSLTIEPVHMGFRPGLNYDDVALIVEYGEGERHT